MNRAMFLPRTAKKSLLVTYLLCSILPLSFSFQVDAQTQTEEWLPRVLVVTSTVEPQGAGATYLWTDLFEYGIVANFSSTSTYNSMNRSNYDIIVFSGYSNPVDPEDTYLSMVTDVEAGRKLVFMGHIPFKQTYPNGTTLKTFYRLGVVDMPQDFPSGSFDESELSLVCNPGDSYLKEAKSSLTGARYFSTLPETAIGWVKDGTSGHYFAIFTYKGGWIGENSCTTLHMGKVLAKIWWGKTNKVFGFSMNVMYGAPIFLWRVDADDSEEEASLGWLSDLSTRHNFRLSVGARGGKITSDVIAGYWRDLAITPLVKIGVHTYTHQGPISAQNITHEVFDTYELLLSHNIPAEKFFLGWGRSDWSWQQIKTLFDYGWTVIHSSWDHGIVRDSYDVDIIANFTDAPPILGNTGRCDWNAYNENFNFTKVNIERYEKCQEAHLPFILYTHDYIYESRYYNDYGLLKDQIEAFFCWLGSQEVYSVWITEYYDFFQDTFTAMITQSDNTFSVTRPKAKANFVKIFVGNNQTYAVGTSVLTQKILDGWLYITLKPEITSTFTLSHGYAPIISVLSPENKTHSENNVPLTFTMHEPTDWIGYSLDGQMNVTLSGNTTVVGLSDGMHTIAVYANDTAGNTVFSDTVYFTVDTTPPNITDVSQIPLEDNMLPEDEVKVSATVTDEISGVKQVTLNYTNGNGTWIPITMTNLEGNVWNATIPAFPQGTNVTYRIIAEDNVNNTITTEDLGYEYQYIVIPEFPLLIYLPLFMIVTLPVLIIYKRKRSIN